VVEETEIHVLSAQVIPSKQILKVPAAS